MPDIRTTPQRDDFQRPDENPVQPPWLQASFCDINMEISGGALGGPSPDPFFAAGAYLSDQAYNGPFLEAWAVASGNMPLHDSYQMGMLTADSSGYILHASNPVGQNFWTIFRLDGGNTTSIASVAVPDDYPQIPDIVLMRLTTEGVEMWINVGGDGETWTHILTAADTTYRSWLYLFLGARGGGPGWGAVGGGELVPKTQIYRYVTN